jgi:hypothetical protein
LTLHAIAEAQKPGIAAFIDANTHSTEIMLKN